MTFKDLQKLIHSQQNTEQNKLFDKLRDKPFLDLGYTKTQARRYQNKRRLLF